MPDEDLTVPASTTERSSAQDAAAMEAAAAKQDTATPSTPAQSSPSYAPLEMNLDLNNLGEGAYDFAIGAGKVTLGLGILTASGASEVFSGGSLTPGAVAGFLFGGATIVDGWFQASIGLAGMFSSITFGTEAAGASSDISVPKSMSEAVGIAGDAFIYAASGNQSTWMQGLGKWFGSEPSGVVDLLLFNSASAY